MWWADSPKKDNYEALIIYTYINPNNFKFKYNIYNLAQMHNTLMKEVLTCFLRV